MKAININTFFKKETRKAKPVKWHTFTGSRISIVTEKGNKLVLQNDAPFGIKYVGDTIYLLLNGNKNVLRINQELLKKLLTKSTVGVKENVLEDPTSISEYLAMPASKLILLSKKPSLHSKKLFEALNRDKQFPDKIFGYWRQAPHRSRDSLPFPVALKIPGYNKEQFIEILRKAMDEAKTEMYRGFSKHRWTGNENGSKEYTWQAGSLAGWKMPSGATLYLNAGVPPSREFYKAVTGRDLNSLPY